ncbi:hypothetical protein SynA18461_02211 [Synechococcus sp. A18-46.1]|nr:hypothetical protein SynA18461_02211 [Synechococcus sp. A18-46.1]
MLISGDLLGQLQCLFTALLSLLFSGDCHVRKRQIFELGYQ